jgi:CheY-like chemotaxis protein
LAIAALLLMSEAKTTAAAILIVEDEPLVRIDMASYNEDAGFTVYEAGNADEAIRILEQHSEIRLIFTDIHMPGSMDGLRLAHYVRGRWPPVKIIVTSGLVKVRSEDLPKGALFVEKPYRPEHVTDRVREMIAA